MARRPGVGQSFNGIFGLLKVWTRPDTPGARDTEHPYRQALRFLAGNGMAVTESDGIVSLNCNGGTGATGDQGETGDQGIQGTIGVSQSIALHDTTHNPVGLWQLQGSLADTSGNGYNGTVNAGTEAYSALVPGLIGAKLDGTLRLALGGLTANLLRITGPITVEMILRFTGPSTANPLFGFTYGVDDASGNFNYLYEIRFLDTLRRPCWFHEFGTGGDAQYNLTDLALPAKRAFHLAVTRNASSQVQFYVDGRPFGPLSSALTAATGGIQSQLYLGGTGGPTSSFSAPMNVASFKVVAACLDAHQIAAEYNRTVGRFYGRV